MKDAVEWFTVNGRPAFKGVVGKYPRLIVGRTREQLEALICQMAEGRA